MIMQTVVRATAPVFASPMLCSRGLSAPRRRTMRLDSVASLIALATLTLAHTAQAQTIVNASFETPVQSFDSYTYDPTGAGVGWAFSGDSGISANGSTFTQANMNAPDGVQVAFVQDLGSMSQSVSFASGTYTLSFLASQRTSGGTEPSLQTVDVTIDSTTVGTFTPSAASTGYQTFTTDPFTLSAGAHTIEFAGTMPPAADYTAFVDNVKISGTASAPEPGSTALVALGGLPVIGVIARRRRNNL